MDEALALACKKLIVLGESAGFSVDDLLTLLLNGMTTDELVDYLQRRLIEIEKTDPKNRVM